MLTALESNNDNIGAGYIEHHGEQYLIRVPGQVKTLDEIGRIIVGNYQGTPIFVRDVAEVLLGKELRAGAATENGRETVLGTVFKLIGENSRMVSQAAGEKLAEINRSMPDGIKANYPRCARGLYRRTGCRERKSGHASCETSLPAAAGASLGEYAGRVNGRHGAGVVKFAAGHAPGLGIHSHVG